MVKSWVRSTLANRRPRDKARPRRRRLSVEGLEIRQVMAAMYDVAWLGTLGPDDNASEAYGINDLGQVVGSSYITDSAGIPTQQKAFLYNQGQEQLTDLGVLNGNASFAWDINNNGTIAGWYHYPMGSGYYEWAAVWTGGVGETISGYDLIGGHSRAFAVNDDGLVVGGADVPGAVPSSEAFVYNGTDVTFLGTLGGVWSTAADINNSGYIAGYADTGENASDQPNVYMSRYHAVIWSPDGTITDLGTLGEDSYAYKINASGQAVGSSIAADGYYHAFLYDGTRLIDIGASETNTQALAINDAGQVVGDTVNRYSSTAFLYENGTTYDLNTLVDGLGSDVIMSAHDINNLGQIVGYGLHNGKFKAFVLTPSGLAEPATPPTDPTLPPTDPVLPPSASGETTVSGPIDGFDGVTGQERTLILTAGGGLASDGYEFHVEWGDGSYDTVNGMSGVAASHVYDAAGSYTVTVRATDSDGETGDPASVELNVHEVEQQGEVLAVGGTAEDDAITVRAGAANGTIVTSAGSFATNRVMVYGHDGSDRVVVEGTAGNDVFGIGADFVEVAGVIVQGNAVERWTAAGLAGDDLFTAVGATLSIQVQGDDGNDRLRVAAKAHLDGRFDGGAGSDTIDYAIFQSSVTVGLQNGTATGVSEFGNIEGLIGSNLTDTLMGANTASTWSMKGYDSGSVNSLQFRSFENWIGGSADDTFKIAAASGVYGVLDGGGGVNTLDYSSQTSGVNVNLTAATAFGARNGVANIDNVFGGLGADNLIGNAGDNILRGNGGDDMLSGGPGGNDVLAGGAGNDTLIGSQGRNILIGGADADVLTGSLDEDILIGGSTNYDANTAALVSLMAEWKRTDLTYQQRVGHLTGTTKGGANGSVILKSKTVKDDKTADQLTGGDGLDWFWGLAVEINDGSSNERRN